MKTRIPGIILFIPLAVLFLYVPAGAQQPLPADKPLKLEGAKMAPVSFSHKTHVETAKVDCAKCHHKDAKEPQACTKCHDPKEAKNGAIVAKDAFHNMCVACHKEKGGKAPTKCLECHKK